jgi:pyroglutamyl-peptidase
MKILVSGFEPYGEMSVNPTQTLAEEAKKFDLDGIEIHSVLLPVNYDECVERLVEEIESVSPDVVVSCGLWPGRTAITPERIGINAKDTMADDPIADNRGRMPVDEPINPEGPDAIFSMLPYRRITENLMTAGIPSFVSNTAGSYICNNTLYGVLDYIKSNNLPIVAGFVHFPASTEMAVENPTQPSLPMEMMVDGLRVILGTVAQELSGSSTETTTARWADS